MSSRELIQPHPGDKRYARRNEEKCSLATGSNRPPG